MKSKSYLGFLMLLALMLFLVLLPSAFSSVYQNTGNGLIPEWTFGTKTQDRVETNQKKECFETDAKQPFKFDVCYVPNRPYREAVIDVVLSPGAPVLSKFEIKNLTNGADYVITSSAQTDNKSEKERRSSFDLAELFSAVKSTNYKELKLVFVATSRSGDVSKVECTLKFQ